MEGACVRSEQGVTITLFLLTCVDSLFHREIAKLLSVSSKSEPITVHCKAGGLRECGKICKPDQEFKG